MTDRTEDRLRDATRALGSVLAQRDIPPLRLPETVSGAARRHASRDGWSRPRLLVPLAAAAAVALIVGLVSFAVRGTGATQTSAGPHPHPRPATLHAVTPPQHPAGQAPSACPASQGDLGSGSAVPATVSPAALTGLPAYLVAVIDGAAAVRSVTTGATIASIPKPSGLYEYAGVSAAADDRTFFLAGAGPRNGRWSTVFYRVRLAADGQPGPVQRLAGSPVSVPFPPVSGGWLTFEFAASPDGSQLAYSSGAPYLTGPGSGFGPPVPATAGPRSSVVVQDVSTGARRVWRGWPSSQAVEYGFSWAAHGQLGFDATVPGACAAGGRLVPHAGGQVTAFLVLQTGTPGSDLFASSRVVSYASPATVHGAAPTLHGVLSTDGQAAYVQRLLTPGHGTSAGSGQLGQVPVPVADSVRLLLTGWRAVAGDPMSVDGSGRYLLLPVAVHDQVNGVQGVAVAAHLGILDLSTGQLAQLPVTEQNMANGAFDAAW